MSVFAEARFFFISPTEWAQPGNANRFLKSLLGLLDHLVEFGPAQLAWCSELDELIWRSPQLPPWRRDLITRNQLIPILYRKLTPLQQYYRLDADGVLECQPERLFNCAERTGGSAVMKQLLHAGIFDADPITAAASAGNVGAVHQTIELQCRCHTPAAVPIIITREDWIRIYDYTQLCWPNDRTQSSRNSLLKAIGLHCEISLKNKINPSFAAEFSNHFLSDLLQTADNRTAIIEALGRRLCRDADVESGSGSLQDESLGNNIWRMRVTLAARIHYERTATGLLFHRYYGESQHNDGI